MKVVMDLMLLNGGTFFCCLNIPDWPDHFATVLGDLNDVDMKAKK